MDEHDQCGMAGMNTVTFFTQHYFEVRVFSGREAKRGRKKNIRSRTLSQISEPNKRFSKSPV